MRHRMLYWFAEGSIPERFVVSTGPCAVPGEAGLGTAAGRDLRLVAPTGGDGCDVPYQLRLVALPLPIGVLPVDLFPLRRTNLIEC